MLLVNNIENQVFSYDSARCTVLIGNITRQWTHPTRLTWRASVGLLEAQEAAGTRQPNLTSKTDMSIIRAGFKLLGSFENALLGRSRPNCAVNDHGSNSCSHRAAGLEAFFKFHF